MRTAAQRSSDAGHPASGRARGPERSPQWGLAFGLACIATLGACAGPRVRIDGEPKDAELFVDGRSAGRGHLELALPYYGTMATRGVRWAPAGNRTAGIGETTVMLPLPEPVTPWLFPFDFVLELATAPFRDADRSLELRVAAPSSEVVEGLLPPRAEELRARAAAARTRR